jgi:hypothetical protein
MNLAQRCKTCFRYFPEVRLRVPPSHFCRSLLRIRSPPEGAPCLRWHRGGLNLVWGALMLAIGAGFLLATFLKKDKDGR